MSDTGPGDLQESPRRRTSDRRTTAHDIADSTALKLIQPIVLGLLLPLISWGSNKVLDRMDGIEQAINASNTIAATNELRLRTVESKIIQSDAEQRQMHDRLNQLTTRVELMDARNQRTR